MATIQLVAGDPIHTWITHLDAENVPILGETFLIDLATRPDDTSFADTITITEASNGRYEVEGTTLPTDPEGEWWLEVIAQSNGRRYQQVFDVTIGRPSVVIAQPPTVGGQTRQAIRRQIARDLGDFYLITATEFGTESSIISEQDLAREYGHFVAMQVVPVFGTEANLYQTGTVTVSSQQNRSVSFVPPLPAATAPGDVFEMYNLHGTGWTYEQYNAAINAAIVRAGEEHGTIDYAADIPGYFDQSNPYIAIPDEFTHVYGLQYIDQYGRRTRIQPTGLTIDKYGREMVLNDKWAYKAHGRALRMLGMRMPGTLETDDARTDMGTEWIVVEAKAQLLERDTARGMTQGARDRLMFMNRQGADGRRPSVVRTYPPNTVKL